MACLSFVSACSDGKDSERTEAARAALSLQVTVPRDVEPYPELHAQVDFGAERIVACGSLRCVIAYSQVVGSERFGFATRVSRTGDVTDTPRIQLGRGRPLAIAARGDEFLIAGDEWTWRLTGATGEVEDVSDRIFSNTAGLRVASSGSTWLFLDPLRFTVLNASTLARIAGGTTPQFAGEVRLTAGQGQYLATWPGHAVRIDASTGAMLDADIEFSRYKQGATSAAFVDGATDADDVYQLVWTTDYDVYGSRIRARDGRVLDPDDHFNQASGARPICIDCNWGGTAFASRVGTSVLAGWVTRGDTVDVPRLAAARIDALTGARVDGKTNAAEFRLGLAVSPSAGAFSTNWGVLLHERGFSALSADPPNTLVQGPTKPVFVAPFERIAPRVASNGTGYLVTWRAGDEVRGTRVSASGAYLDNPPLLLGGGFSHAVARSGSGYLVAWENFENQIERRLVPASGAPGPVIGQPIGTSLPAPGFTLQDLKLTFNGKYHLLSWVRAYHSSGRGVEGLRLDVNGAAVDAEYKTLVPEGLRSLVITADTTPAESERTFLIAYANGSNVRVRRMRSATGALIEPITTHSDADVLAGAGDGTRSLLYYVRLNGERAGLLMEPREAAVQVGPKLLPLDTNLTRVRTVWYDGRSFVVASMRHDGRRPFFARRFDGSLEPLEPLEPLEGTPLTPDTGAEFPELDAASNGPGQSLVAFQQADAARMGTVIKVVLLSNDGKPQVSSLDAGTDADSGAQVDGSPFVDAGPDGVVTPDAGSDASGSEDGARDGDAARNDGALVDAAGDGSAEGGGSSSSDSGGCGCRTAARGNVDARALLALALLLLAGRGRR